MAAIFARCFSCNTSNLDFVIKRVCCVSASSFQWEIAQLGDHLNVTKAVCCFVVVYWSWAYQIWYEHKIGTNACVCIYHMWFDIIYYKGRIWLAIWVPSEAWIVKKLGHPMFNLSYAVLLISVLLPINKYRSNSVACFHDLFPLIHGCRWLQNMNIISTLW